MVITFDLDFGDILALGVLDKPSVIILRLSDERATFGWIRNRWRRAQRGAALPDRQPGEINLAEREVGSSGWIRTSNPPVS